jgi:enoyl-CoA hydratase/carnithine racemase
MSAERAYDIGLVQDVVAAGDLMDVAMSTARLIADTPDQLAVEVTVKAIWTAQYMGIQQALHNAPTLVNLVDGTTAIGERADALRKQKITPRIR